MLTSLRIQNFRSIRDASVKLGQVNLFIGPNNSGKSNFLKGVEFAADVIANYPVSHQAEKFDSLLFRLPAISTPQIERIFFMINSSQSNGRVIGIMAGRDGAEIDFEPSKSTPSVLSKSSEENRPDFQIDGQIELLKAQTENTQRYDINPIFSRFSHELTSQDYFSSNSANIVSFLFTLSQNHRGAFRRLEKDLADCLGDIVSIGTPIDPDEAGKLKIKFFDRNDVGYWAEEVSEGVLYFLALLCIVHQPDPPKLLLLEEPEKGIHPRRIKEVMAFIFELARLRDIQIILTSHSPYVVDHFKDFPQCVSVFDRDPATGETIIHNAKGLIDKTNADNAAHGLPPTDYTSSLGEYWVSGFLGGVPL